MHAPEVYILKMGSSYQKIINVLEKENVPIIKNANLTNSLLNNCNEFEPIPRKYWEAVAKILSKIMKKENASLNKR